MDNPLGFVIYPIEGAIHTSMFLTSGRTGYLDTRNLKVHSAPIFSFWAVTDESGLLSPHKEFP
jgi:hypothetical protein